MQIMQQCASCLNLNIKKHGQENTAGHYFTFIGLAFCILYRPG
jgi:hypothetical protein